MKVKENKGLFVIFANILLLFLYAPLELYFTNKDEFWFDFKVLFPRLIVLSAIIFVIMVGIFWIASKLSAKLEECLIALAFAAYLGFYIQGNFMSGFLPELDGAVVDWSLYPIERIESLILWILLFLGSAFLLKILGNKYLSAIKYVSMFVSLVLLVTIIFLGMSSKGFEKKINMSATTEGIWDFGEKNYIVFLLDTVDSGLMRENTDIELVFAELDGFTFYNNVVGLFQVTQPTVPFLFSGEYCFGWDTYSSYFQEAFLKSPLFEQLEEKGYCVNVYNADMPLKDERMKRFENVVENLEGDVTSNWDFIRWTMQMTLYRYFPFELKKLCFVNPAALNTLKKLPDGYQLFSWDNRAFFDLMENSNVSQKEQPQFKIIHLKGTHAPFDLDANLEPKDGATYEEANAGCVKLINSYILKLKEEGVYNNSTIVIMSDHGYSASWNEPSNSRIDPILFIKNVGERHPLKIDNAPISYADMPDAFVRLIDLNEYNEDGQSHVFDWKDGDTRDRVFYCGGFGGLEECLYEDSSNNESELVTTGKKYN